MKPGHLKELEGGGGTRACQCILDSRAREGVGEGGDGRRSEEINRAVELVERNAISAINLAAGVIPDRQRDGRTPWSRWAVCVCVCEPSASPSPPRQPSSSHLLQLKALTAALSPSISVFIFTDRSVTLPPLLLLLPTGGSPSLFCSCLGQHQHQTVPPPHTPRRPASVVFSY